MARLDTSNSESSPNPTDIPAQLVLPPPPFLPDPVTLPRAAPLPLKLTPVVVAPDGRRTPITVAPTARDVEPSRAQRRIGELALAATLAFGVAWLTRGGLASEPAQAVAPPVAARAAPAVARAAAAPCPLPLAPAARDNVADSQIPLVAVSALPLLRPKATSRAGAERLRKPRKR